MPKLSHLFDLASDEARVEKRSLGSVINQDLRMRSINPAAAPDDHSHPLLASRECGDPVASTSISVVAANHDSTIALKPSEARSEGGLAPPRHVASHLSAQVELSQMQVRPSEVKRAQSSGRMQVTNADVDSLPVPLEYADGVARDRGGSGGG